jgi:glyoxylase-like metal-dependent hydrolase (beta-lactamase superfamily II)
MPLAAGLIVVAVGAVAQDRFAKVEIKITQVADGIYLLQGSGGNIGVCAGPDGVILIDDQFGPLSQKIKVAVAKVSDRPIRFVINTHWNGDHVGSNENFGKDGAVIVAHENVRRRMSVDQFSKRFNDTTLAAPAVALPVVTFTSDVTLHLNGQTVSVVHVDNAHTDGDAFVYFHEANVLHTGDLCFNGLYPFIDLDSGGSSAGMIAGDDRMLGLIGDATQVIHGHGPLTDRAGLRTHRDVVAGGRAAVEKLVKAGKSRDEAIAAKPTAQWDEAWGKNFIKPDLWVGTLYDDLKGKP